MPEKYRENPHLSLDREHVFADFTKYKSGEENHNIQIGQDVPGNQQDGKVGRSSRNSGHSHICQGKHGKWVDMILNNCQSVT